MAAHGEGGAISFLSNCGGWEFMTGRTGDSLIERGDVDSSIIPNCMEMSEFVLMGAGRSVSVWLSFIGTGEEARDEGRLSGLDGGGSTTVA